MWTYPPSSFPLLFRGLSEKVFGIQTNDRAQAMCIPSMYIGPGTCMDTRIRNGLGRLLCDANGRYHDRQWRSSTRQKLMWALVRTLVYDGVRQPGANHYSLTRMALTIVLLTTRRMHWPGSRQQHPHCH